MMFLRVCAAVLAFVCMANGSAAFFIGSDYADKANGLATTSAYSEATVLLRYEERSPGTRRPGEPDDREKRYFLRYSFPLKNGQEFTLTERVGFRFIEQVNVGDTFDVIYAPHDPSIATLQGGFHGRANTLTQFSKWALGLGLAFLVIAIAPWRSSHRTVRPKLGRQHGHIPEANNAVFYQILRRSKCGPHIRT